MEPMSSKGRELMVERDLMKLKVMIVFVVIAIVVAGAALAFGGNDDPACVKRDGNSSLEVSAEKVELLRQHNWKATDETGRLVCE